MTDSPVWTAVAEGPMPDTGATDVWWIRLASFASMPATLFSAEEIAHAEQAGADAYRYRYLAARAATKNILAFYLERPPAQVHLERDRQGKPHLAGPPPRPLAFNLSHSGDRALLAVSRSGAVGADLEPSATRVDWSRMAGAVFSPAERIHLDACSEPERSIAALRGWVRKEAYTKALGAGFRHGFANIEVSLLPGSDDNLLRNDFRDPDAPNQWWVREIGDLRGWTAAVAGAGAPGRIAYWRPVPR